MNAIISGLCCVLARFMIANDELTLEDRMVIRDILKPYIEMMTTGEGFKAVFRKLSKRGMNSPVQSFLNLKNTLRILRRDTLIARWMLKTEQSLSPYQRLLSEIFLTSIIIQIRELRYGFVDILPHSFRSNQENVPLLRGMMCMNRW